MTIKNIPKLPLLGAAVTLLGVICLIAWNHTGSNKAQTTGTKPVAAHHSVQTTSSLAAAVSTDTPATTDAANKSSQNQSSRVSSGNSTTTAPSQPTSPAPSDPGQPSNPVVTPPTPPAPTVYLTLHPENGTTSAFMGYKYLDIPYAVPSSSTFTYATTCTILSTPLLDNGIWCNGQTKGEFVSVQYDPAVASGHFTVQVTVQLDGVNHTATCDITL